MAKRRKINLKKLTLPIRRFLYNLLTQIQNRQQRPKKYKKIKKSVLAIMIGCASVIFLIFFLQFKHHQALGKLGYTKTQIQNMKKLKIDNLILKNEWYSAYLAQSIEDNSVRLDYLNLYLVVDNITEDTLLLYHRLLDKGYTEETVLSLFQQLKFFEMTPLLLFDLQSDPKAYIEDVTSHRDVNSQDSFTLTNSYYTPYTNAQASQRLNTPSMLVNKSFYLASTYVPSNLVDMSIKYAASGLQLNQEAYDAFKEWVNKALSLQDEISGVSAVRFYAVTGFRTYEKQESLYQQNANQEGTNTAIRPGFSDHQTGYAVDIAATSNPDKLPFAQTQTYQWAIDNASTYGFILRYPANKESITNYTSEPWHFRYVGRELAEKITASKLTFDEYYMLYLSDWNDEANQYPKIDSQQDS